MKKGFTLVELLAVIIIISITSLIVFPVIGTVINNSKKDLYNNQILDIESAAEKWATENSNLLDKYHANDVYIFLESLRFSGYLEPDAIKNPMDRSTMEGCIRIRYNNKQKKYNFTYEEKNCVTYANESNSDEEHGYIIYNYDRSSKTFIKSNSSKEVLTSGLFIFNAYSKLIKTSGDTETGLYDIDDQYIFRGSDPNNYVTLVGKDASGNTKNTSWRILSIDKNDYSLKLISTTPIASNTWDSNNGLTFNGSTISNLLLAKVNDSGVAYDSDKIINYEYQTGNIQSSAFSIDALKSTLNTKTPTSSDNSVTSATNNTSSQKVGTISVLDYVNASATSECPLNYLSDKCRDNNYLYNMFGSSNTTWTLNGNGSQIWYINNNGLPALINSANNKQIYAVVKLSSNTYITNSKNGTGTSTNPYVIK